ncbi:putative methyltransferase DDB_G0268948 [Glandiceps talaboti]
MDTTFTELFAGAEIAEAYLKFRPTYPKEVVYEMIEFLKYKNPGPWRLAIDVGCGSGQSTRFLSDHFETVIGCDVSKAQLDAAKDRETPRNVKYDFGSDESIPADDNAVDLITVAQAIHWFDLKKFYKEVDRVLKPNGCLAIYGHGVVQFTRNTKGPELQAVHDEFRYGTLKEFCLDRHKHSRNRYTDIALPYEETDRYDSIHEIDTTVEGCIGYLSSITTYHKFLSTYPERKDILEKVLQRFMTILEAESPPQKTRLLIDRPVFLLMGRKPGKLS